MIAAPAGTDTERFRLSERAERLRGMTPRVYGYRWRHAFPKASLILLHGLQSHAGWFTEAADGLVDRGFAVYAPDRRGSGCSPDTRGHVVSFSDWYDDVCAVIRQAQADYPSVPAHLVGHCFGGNVALGCVLALRPPVRSVIVLAPGLHLRSEYRPWEKLSIGISGVLRPDTRFRVPLKDEWFTRDPEVLGWIQQDRLGARTLTARCLLQIRRMNRQVRRCLPELQLPLLVVEAERDRISDNGRNRRLLGRALGDRCQFRSFDGEHFLLAEPFRDRVIDALEEWVTSLETPGC